MLEVIEQTASRLFIPLTVGGGIQSLDDITELLNHGARYKVSLNSSALKNPQLIKQASDKFGRQCICIALIAIMILKEKHIIVVRMVVKK